MSYLKLDIETTNIGFSEQLDRLAESDPKQSLNSVVQILNALQLGSASTLYSCAVAMKKAAAKAEGLVHIAGTVSVDDVLTLNGVAFTAKASPSGEVQFQSGADPAVSAASFVAKVNACTDAKITSITASNTSGEVTLTVDEPGAVGNGFSIIKTTGAAITVTDFTGGSDGTSYSLSM